MESGSPKIFRCFFCFQDSCFLVILFFFEDWLNLRSSFMLIKFFFGKVGDGIFPIASHGCLVYLPTMKTIIKINHSFLGKIQFFVSWISSGPKGSSFFFEKTTELLA